MNDAKELEKTIEERIKELESQVDYLTGIKYIHYIFGCLYFSVLPYFVFSSYIDWLFPFSIVYIGIIFFGEIIIKGLRFLLKQNNNNPPSNNGEEK